MDRQIDRRIDELNGMMDQCIDGQKDKWIHRLTGRYIDGRRDGLSERDREREREIYIYVHIYIL